MARFGIERADAVWAVAADWTADLQEMEPSWRVQLGVGADGDLWEVMDLLLERTEGRVEVHWVRGHDDSEENDEQASERECQG